MKKGNANAYELKYVLLVSCDCKEAMEDWRLRWAEHNWNILNIMINRRKDNH